MISIEKTHKYCAKCDQEHPISNFRTYTERKTGKPRISSKCKPCEDRLSSERAKRKRDEFRTANPLPPKPVYTPVPPKLPRTHKTCPDCNEVKELSCFRNTTDVISGGIRYITYCKPCENKRRDARRKEYKSEGRKAGEARRGRAKYARKRELDPEHGKKTTYQNRLKYLYNLEQHELDQMILVQNNCCAICGKHADQNPYKKLSIDHDHSTGKVRELLCNQCNRTLGLAKDDPEILRAMAAYIEKHK